MQRGFSIIEILIAMAIALIVISGVTVSSGGFGTALHGYQSTVMNGQINAEAAAKAQQVLEQSQALGRQDFNLVNPIATTSIDGQFYKNVDVQLQPDFQTKLITATILWLNDRDSTSTMRVSTLATNLENVNSPNTCSSVLSGDWSHPQIISFKMNDLIATSSGTYTISDVDVYDRKLYVSVSDTLYKTDPTLFVIDVSDPMHLALEGKLDNNPASARGLAALQVTRDYVAHKVYMFAAGTFSRGQLQVFDATDSASPFLLKTYKIPLGNVPSAGDGNSIFYKDGYVFLGVTKTSSGGTELNRIDVGGGGTASPTNPIWTGGYSLGSGVNAIVVKREYAYLASPNSENMTILDIQNPLNPAIPRVGGYTPPAGPETNGVGSNHGERLFVVGNNAYLGRTYGTNELYALDISDPGSFPLIGNGDIGAGNQTSIYGLVARGPLALLVTRAQIQVWDISDPHAIQQIPGSSLPLSSIGAGAAADCEGNVLYVALNDTSGNGSIALVTSGL